MMISPRMSSQVAVCHDDVRTTVHLGGDKHIRYKVQFEPEVEQGFFSRVRVSCEEEKNCTLILLWLGPPYDKNTNACVQGSGGPVPPIPRNPRRSRGLLLPSSKRPWGMQPPTTDMSECAERAATTRNSRQVTWYSGIYGGLPN
jgi:hypothetical protein